MKLFKPLTLLLVIFLNAQTLFSQGTSFELRREITINSEDSEIKEIPLNVKLLTSSLDIRISSEIYKGDLTIEIYNSMNVKKGEFSIQSIIPDGKTKAVFSADKKEMILTKDESSSEVVSGEIKKIVNNPMVGKWYIKITPKKVSGKINIYTRFNLDD